MLQPQGSSTAEQWMLLIQQMLGHTSTAVPLNTPWLDTRTSRVSILAKKHHARPAGGSGTLSDPEGAELFKSGLNT